MHTAPPHAGDGGNLPAGLEGSGLRYLGTSGVVSDWGFGSISPHPPVAGSISHHPPAHLPRATPPPESHNRKAQGLAAFMMTTHTSSLIYTSSTLHPHPTDEYIGAQRRLFGRHGCGQRLPLHPG